MRNKPRSAHAVPERQAVSPLISKTTEMPRVDSVNGMTVMVPMTLMMRKTHKSTTTTLTDTTGMNLMMTGKLPVARRSPKRETNSARTRPLEDQNSAREEIMELLIAPMMMTGIWRFKNSETPTLMVHNGKENWLPVRRTPRET